VSTLDELHPKMAKLLEYYDKYLRDNGVSVSGWTPNFVRELYGSPTSPDGGALSYIRHMIQRMLTEPDIFKSKSIPLHVETPYDEVKLFTWLGFIQGVLWAEGKEGISDIRNQTREVKEKPKQQTVTVEIMYDESVDPKICEDFESWLRGRLAERGIKLGEVERK
jgi:hypothetical protein